MMQPLGSIYLEGKFLGVKAPTKVNVGPKYRLV